MEDATTKTIKWGDKEVTPIARVTDGAYWIQDKQGYSLLVEDGDGNMRRCSVIWGTALDILMRMIYIPEINVTLRRKTQEAEDAKTTEG